MIIKKNLLSLLQNRVLIRLANFLGLTDRVLNLYWKKVSSEFRDSVAQTGFMPGTPEWVYLEATMKCNLKCKICHQKDRRAERREMTTEQIFQVIDKIKTAGIPVINMTGGEMFLRSDILDIIGYANEVKIPLKINTNGTLIDRNHIRSIRECETFYCLGTSIDGTQEMHNKARGSDHAFDLTVTMLKAFGKTHFQKMVCFTMTEQNKDCIEDMLKLAGDLEVDRLLFMNEHFACLGDIEESCKILGIESSDSIFIGTDTKGPGYANIMIAAQNKIKTLRKKYDVLAPIYPILASNRPNEFYARKYSCSITCKAFNAFVIANNGDVRVCQFIKEPVGNILNSSIAELWNCEKMKRLRMAILSNKTMLPICASCPCIEEVEKT